MSIRYTEFIFKSLERRPYMKFKKISARMLTCALPVLIIPMLILTAISITRSKEAITDIVEQRMDAEITAAKNHVEEKLRGITTAATVISDMVAGNYSHTSAREYQNILTRIIKSDDMILGSGLWFEPYVFDSAQEYFGPYVYKDGGNITITYDYSNAEYDYFSQEYYLNAKQDLAVKVTDPYYDETSGLIMSTCSAPILAEDGTYLGCVTVDIELTTITTLVEDIKVGDSGRAIMLDSVGTYLAGVSADLISNAANIADDPNTSLAEAGRTIMSQSNGILSYEGSDGEETAYFSTIPSTGWKLMLHVPDEEIFASVNTMTNIMVMVSIVALIVEILLIWLVIRDISKKTIVVKNFVGELAQGNFTIDPLKVTSADEIGVMSDTLNDMYSNNKGIISGIAEYAASIDKAAVELNNASSELELKFEEIRTMTSNVNDEMGTTSSATEEVNASSEEVLSNVTLLTGETEKSMSMSNEILERAAQITAETRKSSRAAQELTETYKVQLAKCIEGAQVVANVSTLADVISNIAEEINLLSLNASIESARAGEAGRGFAVVANEIGSLAGSTTETVGEIQKTITDVQKAFSDLTDSANDLLNFLQTTVTPDYNKFVEITDQYGKDAQSFKENSSNISDMANNIKTIIGEVTLAIQDIADATSSTTDISRQILEDVSVVSSHVSNVASMAENQQTISDSLTDTVHNFKL